VPTRPLSDVSAGNLRDQVIRDLKIDGRMGIAFNCYSQMKRPIAKHINVSLQLSGNYVGVNFF
jgi:hypothetical protein